MVNNLRARISKVYSSDHFPKGLLILITLLLLISLWHLRYQYHVVNTGYVEDGSVYRIDKWLNIIETCAVRYRWSVQRVICK